MSWKEKYKGCLSPSGRLKSSVSPELKTEVFIARAREVHRDKYDYSSVKYRRTHDKVTIICPEHGAFEQSPASHLSGSGCLLCSGKQKKTVGEFVSQARRAHGHKFDYSKVVYKNTDTKVEIICPEHGSFFQAPSAHLRGQGCPSCCVNKKSTTEEFVAKALSVHGTTYSYDNVEYINSHTKVKITCPEHGEFEQTPNNHLTGQRCPHCHGSIKKTTEEFVAKALSVHGTTYTYDNVEYVNYHTKVKITCSDHGDFEQTPASHLAGKGCPSCAVSNQDTVYLIEYLSAGVRVGTKVGITNSFDKRFSELKRASPYSMEFVQYWIVDNPRAIESAVLGRFTKAGKLGASFSGSTEILEEPTEQIAQFIEGLVYASI